MELVSRRTVVPLATQRFGYVFGFALLLLAGCGGLSDEPNRVIVFGKVTYQGKSIENGQIRFVPIEGTTGPVSGAPIVDGSYSVDHKGGVPVGTHRVELSAFRNLPPGREDPLDSDATIQYLPSKFNTQSELRFAVPSDGDPINKDFDLSN